MHVSDRESWHRPFSSLGVAQAPKWLYLIALVPAGLVVLAAAGQPWVPIADLFQDPFTVVHRRESVRAYPHYGVVSHLGVLLWCAAASICLFASALLISRGAARREIAFMIYAGLLTAMLMLDDLFLGHEVLYRFILSVSETHVLMGYIAALLAYLVLFRRIIMRMDFEILALGLGFFALSALFDSGTAHADALGLLVEDGAKFLGIACWTAFHFRAAWRLSPRGPAPASSA